MDQIISFLAMGGYAAFVWPSFGVTFAVVIYLAWASRRDLRRAQARLAVLEAARKTRRREKLSGPRDAA